MKRRRFYVTGGRDRGGLLYCEVGRCSVTEGGLLCACGADPRLRLTWGWLVLPSVERIGGVLYLACGPLWVEVNL